MKCSVFSTSHEQAETSMEHLSPSDCLWYSVATEHKYGKRGARHKVWCVLGFLEHCLDVNQGTSLSRLMLLVILSSFWEWVWEKKKRKQNKTKHPSPDTNHGSSALENPRGSPGWGSSHRGRVNGESMRQPHPHLFAELSDVGCWFLQYTMSDGCNYFIC